MTARELEWCGGGLPAGRIDSGHRDTEVMVRVWVIPLAARCLAIAGANWVGGKR